MDNNELRRLIKFNNKYVITKKGTLGRVVRCYKNMENKEMVIIEWGPLGWISPVFEKDVHVLSSRQEADVKAEAKEWLKSNKEKK